MTTITSLIHEAQSAIAEFTLSCSNVVDRDPRGIVESAESLERALARLRLRHVTNPEELVDVADNELDESVVEQINELDAKLAWSMPAEFHGRTVLRISPEEDPRAIASDFYHHLDGKKVRLTWDTHMQEAQIDLTGLVGPLLQQIDPYREDAS